MSAVMLFFALLQAAECREDERGFASEASSRVQTLDADGALEVLRRAAAAGCADAEVPLAYLQGLAAARAAYARGGSPESLAPVTAALAVLDREAPVSVPATIARYVLRAAAAAAQSERDEMALILSQALRVESLQFAARQPGAPLVTAHEVAGDLWLRVHRYEEARQAYLDAFRQVGPTVRVRLGLAAVAARLDDAPTACGEYRALVEAWAGGGSPPEEIQAARAFVARPACATGPQDVAGPFER